MEARNFVGKDMDEALRALRASLGPDALILQTRHVPAGRGTAVEITALPDQEQNGTPSAPPVRAPQVKNVSPPPPPVREPQQMKPTPPPRHTRPPEEVGEQQALHQLRSLLFGEREQEPETSGEIKAMRRELSEMKSLFRWFAPHLGHGTIVEELLNQGLSPETLARVMEELSPQGGDERTRVRQALARIIPIGGQLETQSNKREGLALIGPTGVGKTTTIVRLTAHFARRGGRRIGWISLDNRRLAGSEQLAAYAGVLGVPCEVAENTEQFRRAYEKLSPCDLIFVDTAGISPREESGLTELARFMRDIPELRRSLLLNATTNGRDMSDWVKRYEQTGFDSLLFTKLDEGRYFGSLVNTTLACGRPLSYLAVGQNVTNSLEPANADTLAQLLLP
jgi:flagellar biosynthesis protein FlhF